MSFLAKNLRLLRQQRQLSQQKLADALGLSRSKIASYESGRIEPKVDYLLRISRYFEVDLNTFLGADLATQPIPKYLYNIEAPALAQYQQQVEQLAQSQQSLLQLHMYRQSEENEKLQAANAFGLISDLERLLDLLEKAVELNRSLLQHFEKE